MKSSVTLRQISALLLPFLLTLLTGCAPQQKPLVEYRTTKQPRLNLPIELTQQISIPVVPDKLNFGDSVALSAELYGLLGQCNIDRAAIRKIEQESK